MAEVSAKQNLPVGLQCQGVDRSVGVRIDGAIGGSVHEQAGAAFARNDTDMSKGTGDQDTAVGLHGDRGNGVVRGGIEGLQRPVRGQPRQMTAARDAYQGKVPTQQDLSVHLQRQGSDGVGRRDRQRVEIAARVKACQIRPRRGELPADQGHAVGGQDGEDFAVGPPGEVATQRAVDRDAGDVVVGHTRR